MPDPNTLILLLLTVIAVITALEAALERRAHTRMLRAASQAPVTDLATGLLARSAFEQRAQAELSRADRLGLPLVLTVSTVPAGSPELWGLAVARDLPYPSVGFRLADNLTCTVAIDGDDVALANVALRRNALTGCARFPADGTSLESLLAMALADLRRNRDVA